MKKSNNKKGIAKVKGLSVKLRVTLWYTAIMLTVSTLVLIAVTTITGDMMRHEMESLTARTVDDLSRMVRIHEDRPMLPPGKHFYERGVHMALYDSEHNPIGGEMPFDIGDAEFDFSDNNVRESTYGGDDYFEYDRLVRMPDRSVYWLKGIMPTKEREIALNTALRNNVILTAVLILLAGVGGYIIISRAFVPVNKISKTAKEIAESRDLSRRINLGKGNDEIHALAATFDEMLDRIESSFEREKQFTSDASHELRTPVAVILSECEYMQTCAKTGEEFAESAESVRNQAKKMQKLISELLTITRMDKNTAALSFEHTNVSELLDFVCDEQQEIHESTVTLHRSIFPNINADIDRSLIARLFINLISNAYRYNKENGEIHVSLEQLADKIIFSVTDNGIGISEEDLPKIWERFYQADPARSSDDGSVGLGLSMVKWIAEQHGGSVKAESSIGVGSTFTFEFPAARVLELFKDDITTTER